MHSYTDTRLENQNKGRKVKSKHTCVCYVVYLIYDEGQNSFCYRRTTKPCL